MHQPNDSFVVLDLETTGLDPQNDKICEVAWSLTRGDLQFPTEIRNRVVLPYGDMMERIKGNAFVYEMHEGTGLLHDLNHPELCTPLARIEDELLQHMEAFADDDMRWHLVGLSIHFDASFIKRYMPRLHKRLHHRQLDATSLKLALGSVGITLHDPDAAVAHRAGADVQEVLDYVKAFQKFAVGRNLVNTLNERAHDPHLMKGVI